MDGSPKDPRALATLPLRNEFDEDGYLALHPDVAAAVSSGVVGSGWQHFALHGCFERRQWVPKTDRMLGLNQEISPNDEMFARDEVHYFDVGESALHCIESALFTANRNKSSVRRILDLPCGHGRVMRFLKKRFPEAELTAVDLNRDGVDFCSRIFGAIPVVSDTDVERINLQGEFDLIWCGSLLTHLSETNCRAFLRFFQRVLGRGGVLVFTTHGRHYERLLGNPGYASGLHQRQVSTLLSDYRQTGFGYANYPDSADYGFSLSHPAFVMNQLVKTPEWRVIGFHEQGWDKRQDVISVQSNISYP